MPRILEACMPRILGAHGPVGAACHGAEALVTHAGGRGEVGEEVGGGVRRCGEVE